MKVLGITIVLFVGSLLMLSVAAQGTGQTHGNSRRLVNSMHLVRGKRNSKARTSNSQTTSPTVSPTLKKSINDVMTPTAPSRQLSSPVGKQNPSPSKKPSLRPTKVLTHARTSPKSPTRSLSFTDGNAVDQLQYYNGPVLNNVKVTPIFWGANVANASSIAAFYKGIVNSTYLDWLSECT